MSRKVDVQLPTLLKMKAFIIGDQSTGKTAFIKKYLNPSWRLEKCEPTVGIDYYSQRLDVEGSATYAHFWDLSGNNLYIEVRNEFYPEVNGIFLVFDVTDRASFEHLDTWVEEGTKYNADWMSCVLIGTKSDASAVVTNDEANAWAKKHHMKYYSTSAKTGANIPEAVAYLLSVIKKKLG